MAKNNEQQLPAHIQRLNIALQNRSENMAVQYERCTSLDDNQRWRSD